MITLTERELQALKLKNGKGLSYGESGRMLGISKERIRQLIKNSEKKLNVSIEEL